MGVTIHYEGTLCGEHVLSSVFAQVRSTSSRLSWPLIDISAESAVLERVINDEDCDYHGRVRGLRLQPHEFSEPLHIAFGDDLFMQDFCKTQFAGVDTHIAVVELLRAIAPSFSDLSVYDEGEFWETGDKDLLRHHFTRSEELLAEFAAKNPHAKLRVRLPSGRLADAWS